MEIFYENNNLVVSSDDNKKIIFSPESNEVSIDDYSVSYPWEYEKSGILLEVKEYNGILFYKFTMNSKHIGLVTYDSFELKEEILSFFET